MRILPLLFCLFPTFALAGPLQIVTDIPPVHSLVSQVIGDRGDVTVLLDPNADPHHFQLRPSQSREIARADALIWIGEDLTPWLARAKDGIAADLPSLTFFESDEDAIDDHGAHEGDLHIWLSTQDASDMIAAITERLNVLDPDGADLYTANAEIALNDLTQLFEAITETLSSLSGIPFVVGHDGYSHFVAQFGLTQVGSLSDAHDSPASAKHVSKLTRLAAAGDITCVFPEVGESDKLASVLADKGARMGAALDPVGVTLELGPDLHKNLLLQLANDMRSCLSP